MTIRKWTATWKFLQFIERGAIFAETISSRKTRAWPCNYAYACLRTRPRQGQ